jgi:hypothetical protein
MSIEPKGSTTASFTALEVTLSAALGPTTDCNVLGGAGAEIDAGNQRPGI